MSSGIKDVLLAFSAVERFQQPMIEKMIEKVKENLIETILDVYAPKSVTEIFFPLKNVRAQ